MKKAYIINGYRSIVAKSGRGSFRNVRPDELASQVIKYLMKNTPNIEEELIDDIIVGNATPEAEQGLNVGRMISLMGMNTEKVPGMTVNRYCSSGLESIAIANAKITSGMADCIIAGGVESMSSIPFGGWRVVPNSDVALQNPSYYWGMGLTAEEVAQRYNVSREMQDEFSFNSHKKALNAIDNKLFDEEICPIEIENIFLDENMTLQSKKIISIIDEGPRKDTSIDSLNKLKPVFMNNGTITAGNSSQTSDGAAFVIIVSEEFVNKYNLKPKASLLSYQVAALEPKIMGMGPYFALPKALEKINMNINQLEQVELNEAFASQSVAVINQLKLNPEIVNMNGGAIALGHPLGCTGAKLTIQLINDMKRRKQKYGAVTMCVGSGQGAAGIFEVY